MTFSFDTLFITLAEMIFWTASFSIILRIAYWKKVLLYINADTALCLYGICLLRVLMPVDLQYSRKINLSGVYSWLFEKLVLEFYTIGMWKINLLFVFCLIWIIGMIASLIKYIADYSRVKRMLMAHSVEWIDGNQVREKLLGCFFKGVDPEILVCSLIQVPMASGLFHKVIFLPDEKYTSDQYYNILIHEFTHHKNHDLWIKVIVHTIHCIFWWNPVVIMLYKRVNMLLEIRCDERVTLHMDSEGKKEYLFSLMEIAGIEMRLTHKNIMTGIAMFAGTERNLLEERFEQIIRKKRSQDLRSSVCMIGIVFLAFFLSYSVAPMPAFSPPPEDITEDGAIEVESGSFYINKTKDGIYYLAAFSDSEELYVIPEEFVEDYLEQGFELKYETN